MVESGSMFLIELIVPELRSYVKCKDFLIKSHFADVFSVILKDPNEFEKIPTKKNIKRKKVRQSRKATTGKPEYKVQSGQSVLIANDIECLATNMKMYPMELSLWSKIYPKYKIASTSIPWNSRFIEYIEKVGMGRELQPLSLTGDYNVFDEVTSRRMAVLRLNIKMSYLPNTMTVHESDFMIYDDHDLSRKSSVLQPVEEKPFDIAEETGIIKTSYSGGKKIKKKSKHKKGKLSDEHNFQARQTIVDKTSGLNCMVNKTNSAKIKKVSSIISLVKSDMDIDKNKHINLMKCKSCSSMNENIDILNYIFGDPISTFGNQVYCVNYFTVQDLKTPDSPSSKGTPKSSNMNSPQTSIPTSPKVSEDLDKSEKSSLKKWNEAPITSIDSLDLPKELKPQKVAEVKECKDVTCKYKDFRKLPPPPDDRILLDLSSLNNKCCDKNVTVIKKVEKVVGGMIGMIGKMGVGNDPCYCECQCKYGFTKETRYCKICGGYEIKGEEFKEEMPFPCPIYHNLDKPKTKPSITSDTKKLSKSKSAADKSIESDKETKKGKKKKKEDKFKFNYGYTAPRIGHDGCALPCTGTLGAVPKSMGWLWTAEDIPGMKFRPLWRPGAVNKHVLRLLRMATHPGEVFNKKKRRKNLDKGKRPLKRPLLVVHKKDGEYTVTMETMKTYNKPRAINQVPYEDKPAITYTIGRTEEENRQRLVKKERTQRRLERAQREFIQSAFRDMCQEICLKTYQQALGILPGAEDPDCTCYPADPGPDRTDLDRSCSCSEDTNLTFSETDSDEWLIEFTPPNAAFDPTYKSKKINTVENSSQYTYLDYRVKLLDRYGNPVPRFFKGPDGKEQCSDLGGFWSHDKKWLEINIDGYIGPDGKWAPNIFIGPDGDNVDAELGKFQAADGTWLVVGIDGYVDVNGKWRFYSKGKFSPTAKKRRMPDAKMVRGGRTTDTKKTAPVSKKKSEATWSCFGDANPKYLSKLGILGHGHDRKLLLDTLNTLIAQGEDVKIPTPSAVPRSKRKRVKVKYQSDIYDADKYKCKHSLPSSKGVIATDEDGNKIYFRLDKYKNKRPKERMADLTSQGISLSSFHVPCFRSFINAEVMKKQQYDRQVARAKQRGQNVQRGYSEPSRLRPQPEPAYRNVLV